MVKFRFDIEQFKIIRYCVFNIEKLTNNEFLFFQVADIPKGRKFVYVDIPTSACEEIMTIISSAGEWKRYDDISFRIVQYMMIRLRSLDLDDYDFIEAKVWIGDIGGRIIFYNIDGSNHFDFSTFKKIRPRLLKVIKRKLK